MRPGAAAALVAAAALALAGCSGGGDEDGPAARPEAGGIEVPRSAAPGDVIPEDRLAVGSERPADEGAAAVYNAYVDFRKRHVAALRSPVLAASLLQHSVDPQRSRVEKEFSTLEKKKRHAVGELRINPTGIRVSDSRATLRDCLDDSGMTLQNAQGEDVPGWEGEAQPVTVTLVKAPGTWLVSDVKKRSGSC